MTKKDVIPRIPETSRVSGIFRTKFHSANKKMTFAYHNPIECAVWHRLDDNDVDFDGFTIIFGHTPTEYFQECTPMSIWYSEDKKKIGIDCGCGYPSQGKNYSDNPMITRLGCLRLDDMKEFYSEEPEGEEKDG